MPNIFDRFNRQKRREERENAELTKREEAGEEKAERLKSSFRLTHLHTTGPNTWVELKKLDFYEKPSKSFHSLSSDYCPLYRISFIYKDNTKPTHQYKVEYMVVVTEEAPHGVYVAGSGCSGRLEYNYPWWELEFKGKGSHQYGERSSYELIVGDYLRK